MSKLDQLKALGDAKRAARKSSDGDVESRHLAARPLRANAAKLARVAPSPSESVVARTDVLQTVGATASVRDGLPKRGRPRIGEPKIPRAEPWKALGMSERTYYRRLAHAKLFSK
jgi:hypothetical protein